MPLGTSPAMSSTVLTSPRPHFVRPSRNRPSVSISLWQCPLLVWGASLCSQDWRQMQGNHPHVLIVGRRPGMVQPPTMFLLKWPPVSSPRVSMSLETWKRGEGDVKPPLPPCRDPCGHLLISHMHEHCHTSRICPCTCARRHAPLRRMSCSQHHCCLPRNSIWIRSCAIMASYHPFAWFACSCMRICACACTHSGACSCTHLCMSSCA